MKPEALSAYADRIESDLRQNILPFWLRHSVDRERGGIIGEMSNDLVINRTVPRGALLSSRILWTFSSAYRKYNDAAYLALADSAYADLRQYFYDSENGGYYWSIAADGRPVQKRKQIYGQAFAIYALTEYHRATGRREPLDQAIAVYLLIEQHAHDRKEGGYFEAFDADWRIIDDVRLSPVDLNEPKSQNTHLHLMEAYTNLLRVWPDAGLRSAQAALVDTMLTRIFDQKTYHLGLFFSADWQLRCDRFSYGHDIEAAWLMHEAAWVLGDPLLRARVKNISVKIADVTLAEGIDTDGAVFNEGGPGGLTNTDKDWWPQAEAMVGFLDAYEIGGDERHLKAALRTWDFIETKLVDRAHGEWLRGVTRKGDLLAGQPKLSFWKCPYHNGRAGIEACSRLRSLAAKSSS